MREFISFQQKHGSRGSWNYQGAASPICFVTLKHLSVLGVPVTIKQTEDVTAHTAHSLLWGTVTKSCVLLLTLLSSESLLCDVCQLIWIYDKQGFGISPQSGLVNTASFPQKSNNHLQTNERNRENWGLTWWHLCRCAQYVILNEKQRDGDSPEVKPGLHPTLWINKLTTCVSPRLTPTCWFGRRCW